MDQEFIKQQFGEAATYTTTRISLGDVLYEVAVNGKDGSFSWQDTYRRIIEDLQRSIPALEAAGIK